METTRQDLIIYPKNSVAVVVVVVAAVVVVIIVVVVVIVVVVIVVIVAIVIEMRNIFVVPLRILTWSEDNKGILHVLEPIQTDWVAGFPKKQTKP